jgi:hypothetical protein
MFACISGMWSFFRVSGEALQNEANGGLKSQKFFFPREELTNRTSLHLKDYSLV